VLEDALNRISKLEKTKLSALQPVIPTQNWIPVSERLPEVMDGTMGEVSNDVLMCVTDTDGEGITISTGFYGYYPNCSAMIGWWCMWAHGCTKLNDKCKVVAWMPLPQPYKGENESEKCRGCHYNDGKPHAECVVCDKAAGKDAKEKVIAEIDKQGEWLAEAGYNAYNVDIAFGSIIRALRKWGEG
jgi:hypothetical protein